MTKVKDNKHIILDENSKISRPDLIKDLVMSTNAKGQVIYGSIKIGQLGQRLNALSRIKKSDSEHPATAH